jgi:hypothetical protein
MGMDFPPVEDIDTLKLELSLVPRRARADAIQEAWVAHLEKRDVIAAVRTFKSAEQRYAARRHDHIPIEINEEGEAFAVDRDGNRHSLPATQQSHSSAGIVRRNSLAKAG